MDRAKMNRLQHGSIVTLLLAVGAVMIPVTASAQVAGTSQIFVGYSLIEMAPDRAGEREELTGKSLKDWLHGWHTSITYWPTGRLGLMAELSSHYDGEFPLPPNVSGVTTFSLDQIQFMVGPRIKMLQRGRLSSSFQATFGVSIGETFPAVADINDDVIGPFLRTADETVFAMDIGSSFDISLNDTVAVRLQPNLNITNYADEYQTNFRFSTGLLFSWF